jgi:hypothetical protein
MVAPFFKKGSTASQKPRGLFKRQYNPDFSNVKGRDTRRRHHGHIEGKGDEIRTGGEIRRESGGPGVP